MSYRLSNEVCCAKTRDGQRCDNGATDVVDGKRYCWTHAKMAQLNGQDPPAFAPKKPVDWDRKYEEHMARVNARIEWMQQEAERC